MGKSIREKGAAVFDTADSSQWISHDLCAAKDLSVGVCIQHGGQSFTWIQVSPDEWANVIQGYLVIVGQKDGRICVKYLRDDRENGPKVIEAVRDYFRLGYDLAELYKVWSGCDGNFAAKCAGLDGVRLLRQAPMETLFAFICSQNNGIGRIGKMVKLLASRFGQKIATVNGQDIFAFPHCESFLGEDVVEVLRAAGFGYRARYIHQAALHLKSTGLAQSLSGLREQPYEKVIQTLIEIPGVGPKVADCVALMSMDKLEAVPIDTHIWRIACKNYRWAPKDGKSLTKHVYGTIGDNFRTLFGPMAGWAHSVLFTAELSTFKAK